MPHLSELHGAATHLAVVAIPVFVILLAARRAGVGGTAVMQAEPWALGRAWRRSPPWRWSPCSRRATSAGG